MGFLARLYQAWSRSPPGNDPPAPVFCHRNSCYSLRNGGPAARRASKNFRVQSKGNTGARRLQRKNGSSPPTQYDVPYCARAACCLSAGGIAMIYTEPLFLGITPTGAQNYIADKLASLKKPIFNACAGRFSVAGGASPFMSVPQSSPRRLARRVLTKIESTGCLPL